MIINIDLLSLGLFDGLSSRGSLSGGSGFCCRSGLFGAAAAGGLLLFLLGGSEGGLVEVDKLDKGHVGTVTETETGVKDAGVSARTVGDLRSDDTEEFLNSFLVLEVTENYTA